MALNLSGLPDYVSQKSKELVTDAVLGSQTVQILKAAGAVQFGVKGKAAVNTLSVSVNLQSGVDCGRTPAGSTTIGQATIEVVPLKDEQNFCPKAYENKWTGEFLTKGQTYSELLFAQEIMNQRAVSIAAANEALIWKGDKTSTDANLNKIDGFVKQIKASAAKSVAMTGLTSTVEKLQALFAGAPVVTQVSPDARLFIGTEVFNKLKMEMAKEKLYISNDDKTLWGTSMKIEVVDGLIGSNFAVIAKPQHLIYGTDLLGEEEKAEMYFSGETKQIYMDFHFALGVVPVKTAEMAYAAI